MYKTFLKSLALKSFQNFFFYKYGSLGSTACFENNHGSPGSTDRFEIKTGACAQPFVFKSLREPGLNRASNLYGSLCSSVHQWLIFQNYMIMLIKHQPLEAYTCLLYPNEHESLGIDRTVEGPMSASAFPLNMVELTCVSITII